eukprot:1394337-Amorphochlora_amoeboformis.AAC.1
MGVVPFRDRAGLGCWKENVACGTIVGSTFHPLQFRRHWFGWTNLVCVIRKSSYNLLFRGTTDTHIFARLDNASTLTVPSTIDIYPPSRRQKSPRPIVPLAVKD